MAGGGGGIDPDPHRWRTMVDNGYIIIIWSQAQNYLNPGLHIVRLPAVLGSILNKIPNSVFGILFKYLYRILLKYLFQQYSE